jgi:3-hydroxyisobutyrate dehydrogenase-like beta-hydroxyacid dehydrogenase
MLSHANRKRDQIMTANQHTATAGFIGLGDQGAPMAQAIGGSGFALHVWARRPQSLDVLARTRHTVHDSPASLASAVDILDLCLRDDRDIWDILGTPGVDNVLRPGLIVASHGTGDPGENREIAGHLAGKSVAYLDAPGGGGAGARARTLTTMAGGDRSAYQTCEPVFATFSRTVAYMGPSGSGQVTKLLNNAMTMSNLDNAVGLIRLVSRLGTDVPAVLDVIAVSSGGSTILRILGTDVTPQIAPHIQDLMRKDIEHFADAIRACGLDPQPLHDRGLAGASGLAEAAALLAASAGR